MDKQLEKEATDYAYGEYEGSHAAVSRSSYIAGATSSSTVKNLEKKVSELKDALTDLIVLKNHKDISGKDAFYEREQPKAWKKANAAIANL